MLGQRASFSDADPDPGAGGDAGAADARMALLLLRASTMKMVRLQLAVERRDRAVALQAVDDLVDLDDRMAAFLGPMPCAPPLEAMLREVDDQRAALSYEKFGLAAGLMRRAEMRPWVETAPLALTENEIVPAEQETLPEVERFAPEQGARRRTYWFGAAFLLLLAAAAGALLWFGAPGQSTFRIVIPAG